MNGRTRALVDELRDEARMMQDLLHDEDGLAIEDRGPLLVLEAADTIKAQAKRIEDAERTIGVMIQAQHRQEGRLILQAKRIEEQGDAEIGAGSLARLAVKSERQKALEECMEICRLVRDGAWQAGVPGYPNNYAEAADDCLEAIRALAGKEE